MENWTGKSHRAAVGGKEKEGTLLAHPTMTEQDATPTTTQCACTCTPIKEQLPLTTLSCALQGTAQPTFTIHRCSPHEKPSRAFRPARSCHLRLRLNT